MGIRRWLRRIERDSKDARDTVILLDVESGEEIEAPRDVFLRILASAYHEEEPDPEIVPLLHRLDRLVFRDNGEPVFLEDMRHSGKTAAQHAWLAEQGEE
jgi:hypothetical protein